MRLNVWMLCLLGILAIATTAMAQPRTVRGSGGGPTPRSNIFIVACNDAVQMELGLSADEIAKVTKVADEYDNANREAVQSSGIKLGVTTQAEREKLSSIRKEVTEKFTPNLKAALTADQFSRVQQINYQALRASALLESEVVKALSETAEQQETIRAMIVEYQLNVNEQVRVGGDDVVAKIEEINKERDDKAIEQLTKDQQDKFAALKGKEFDITQLNIINYVPRTRGGGGRVQRGAGRAPK